LFVALVLIGLFSLLSSKRLLGASLIASFVAT
jgi:hypothetical protein